MEPVDPRMGGLLDGAGSGGPDELRSIVSRAGRRRTRLAAVAAGLALAAGGGIGYGAASATGGGSGRQIVATAPVSGAPGAAGAQVATGPSTGPGIPVYFQSLFTRQVGAIDIRGFTLYLPEPVPYQGAYSCGSGDPGFQAEVSTPHMVGIVSGFARQETADGAINYVQPTEIGDQERDPTVVVVAYTATNVAQVKMTFTDGSTDQMAPVDGWSALAERTPTSNTLYGTLTAFDHAGKLVDTVSVSSRIPALPPSGSGSAPSGSAGTGSTGSGTVHAAGGAVSSPPATDSPTSPPAQGNVAYPCKVPPSAGAPGPTCTPSTTVNGANYACATLPPYRGCSASPAMPAASSISAMCSTKPVTPTTSGTTVAPTSGSGG